MKGTFVDTAHWLALLLEDDEYHGSAVAWGDFVAPPLITTQAVLFEVADALAKPRLRPIAISFLDDVVNDPAVTIVQLDTQTLADSIRLFRERGDKAWGLTDCLSFVVMDDHGLSAALTCDHHFVQAGYRALLLEDPESTVD